MIKYIFIGCCAVLISSCVVVGLNVKRKTPSNPSKYPEFTLADTLRGAVTPYRANNDIHYYDINIDVDIDKKYISGYVDICFNALTDIDTIQIDLYENMNVSAILYENDTLEFNRRYKALMVGFRNSLKKGGNYKIRVFYNGNPKVAPRPPWEGGFVWEKDDDKNPWIGVSCELDGASLWWPVKDHLSDEPDSLRMSVTIPQGLFCVSNGRLIDRVQRGSKEKFIWKTTYPINTYNATLYIGNYEHFTLPYNKRDTTYLLDFYVLPKNLELAKEHFKQTIDIISFFENCFGEYPWWRDGYKLVESPYAGMEHQTVIAYGNKYKNFYGQKFDHIILHETAHEWWGNSLTASDYADVWLHEGFATYSEALYVEHYRNYDSYLKYLNFYSLLIKNKQPVIGPFGVNYWNYKDGDVYMKGALILHTLRNIINNDEIFFDILKTYYNQYKYSIVTTEDFINVVNEKTGKDYDWFFNQYLYRRDCPKLEWNYVFNTIKQQYEIKFKWSNMDSKFQLPVLIRTSEDKVWIYPSNKVNHCTFHNGGAVYLNTNNSYISIVKNKKL